MCKCLFALYFRQLPDVFRPERGSSAGMMEKENCHCGVQDSNGVGRPLLERKSSLAGDVSDLEIIQSKQEEALLPLKEDLAEWLNKTLGK